MTKHSKPLTKEQLLGRIYRNAFNRVHGTSTPERCVKYFFGREIMPKEQFINWALEHPIFNRLYDNWVSTGYNIRFVPSPDRLDSSRGYEQGNIEWVVYSENCRRATKRRLTLAEAEEKLQFEINRFINRLQTITLVGKHG